MFGRFTILSLATVSNIQSVIPEPRPQIYFSRGLKHLEDVNTIFYNSIHFFHAMLFALNQDQNETYTFKYMLRQGDCRKFIDAMMLEVNSHEDRDHWTLIKQR